MHPWLIAAILGFIEGLTEFIPVSSTGHLLIAEHWLGHQPQLFNVVIQPAAALALIPIFWNKLTRIFFGLDDPANRDLVLKLGTAFTITVIGGVVMKKMDVALPKELAPIAWATLIGGLVIFAVEAVNHGSQKSKHVTWTLAVAFGVRAADRHRLPRCLPLGHDHPACHAAGPGAAGGDRVFLPARHSHAVRRRGAKELWDDVEEDAGAAVDWGSLGIGALASFISAFAW